MDIDDFLDKEGKAKAAAQAAAAENADTKAGDGKEDLLTQVDHIKMLLTDKKFEAAEKRYMEVREAFTQWTRSQLEQQNKIYVALVSINREMVQGLNSMRQETEKNIQRIYELLQRTQDHINRGEMAVANQLFGEIEGLFNNLSDLVPDKKAQLEHDLSQVRVGLRSRSHVAATAEFQAKFKNIHNMLLYAFELVNRGKTQEAVQSYHHINEMYDSLGEGFLYEKALLYQQILKLYQSVSAVPASQAQSAPQIPDGVKVPSAPKKGGKG
jgi:hypothetical protein